MEKDKKREALADLCHEQWSGWMRYLFEKMVLNRNGELEMPHEFVSRWHRQMNTPYRNLPENEKDSDRSEADKFLKIIKIDK